MKGKYLSNMFNFGSYKLKPTFINPHWRRPETKQYRYFNVDKNLDTGILDMLNSNRNIEITSVCAGHLHPTEEEEIYQGNFPIIVFNYKGNLNDNQVISILRRIPNAIIGHTSKSELLKFHKRFGNPHGFNIQEMRLFDITGTAKGSSLWWRNVANVVSRIN